MLVHVTQSHIERGKPGFKDKCPVALALAEMGYETVSVERRISLTKGNQCYTYDAPEEVCTWIEEFDQEHRGEPFTFMLDEPIRYGRLR